MIFQHTHALVTSGRKWQTRRIVKPYCLERKVGYDIRREWVGQDGLHSIVRWSVGKTYAVQPGRAKKAVGRIRITGIRREDVRDISWDDANAEGFESPLGFLDTWVRMHDKPMAPLDNWTIPKLPERPAERYQAWVIEFELVSATE